MISNPKILAFQPNHWDEVREIYRLGLLTRNATFETEELELLFRSQFFKDQQIKDKI